jgi:alkylation response protein AidB-like acyl-CoA dehydrogenase
MNFDLDPKDEEFRQEVREFIARKQIELSTQLVPGDPYRRVVRAWTQAWDEKGWAVPHWPREWGGCNWPLTWLGIQADEISAANVPPPDIISMDMVAPVLFTYGSEGQKRRYLPRIRTAEEFWCQGFSEPEAGSDTMSLRTSATRSNQYFVVNGRKIWISNAHVADMMFALVRIETPGVRRHPGLSFLLIDMHSPGITVRPIVTIDGGHWVNEVLLEDVRVPASNLVGEPGKGWVYARFLLGNERTKLAGLPSIRRQVGDLKRMLSVAPANGAPPPIESRVWQDRLSQISIEIDALEFVELRLRNGSGGATDAGALAAALKLRSTELRQRVSELALDAQVERSLESPWSMGTPEFETLSPEHRGAQMATAGYLFNRSATIAGGTSEIQRNIIAAVALGL